MAQRPTLKKGMSGKRGTPIGDAIFLWRQFVGLTPAVDAATIDYGTQTFQRTVAWQKKNGLKGDGEVGPATWAKYDSLQYGPPTPEAVEAATTAAQTLEVPSEAHAVQASETISAKSPTPKPHPSAVEAAEKITPKSTGALPTSIPTSLSEAKTAAIAVKDKVTHAVEHAPLWLRIGTATVGVFFALKGVKKAFGL